jgi:hypothetical protein
MPGISVVISIDSLSQVNLSGSLSELTWKEGYSLKKVVAAENLCVALSEYEGYPCLIFEDDRSLILVEGMIYNKSDSVVQSELHNIIDDLTNSQDYKNGVRDFIDTSDGEFLALLYLKGSGDMLLFNDRWARLPVFYSIQDDRFVLSRELKFILHWLPEIRFDRNWMAEFLVFEYNLGDKSLVKGISSMKPSLLLHTSFSGGAIRTTAEEILPASFDPDYLRVPRKDILGRCAELFTESLERRVQKVREKGYGIVADLSGGHDSRAVFAGLSDLGADFLACNDNLTEGDEAEIARQVARLYGKNLIHFSTDHPLSDLQQMQRITYATDSQVNCLTSAKCFNDDLARERSISGRQSHFMGLGGEFLRHRYRPIRHYRDLTDMLLGDGFTNLFKVNDACRIAGIDVSDFGHNIDSEIGRFPERSIIGQVTHLNFERYNKFDNGGENRHRLFSWVVSPFWAKDLFRFVTTKVPLGKIGYIFYADFLRALDPRTWEVPLYAGIMGINPLKRFSSFNFKARLKNAIRRDRYLYGLTRRLTDRRGRSDEAVRVAGRIVESSERSPAAGAYIETGHLRELASAYPDSLHFYQVLTLVLYISEVELRFGGRVSIDG